MKYFCSKCGKTTVYSLELPKFCSNCGQSFTVASKPANNSNEFLKELKLKKLNENHKEEYPIEEISNINFKNIKASFTVDVYKSKGNTIGSLIERPAPPQQTDNIQTQHKSNDEIMNEFRREAGTLRSE